MPSEIREHQIASKGDSQGADGQPIQPVSQIDGIGGPDNNEYNQGDVAQTQVRSHLFEKGYGQMGIKPGIDMECDGDEEGRYDLKGELPGHAESATVFSGDF